MAIAVFMRHGHYPQPQGVPSAHLPYRLSESGAEQAQAGALSLAHWLSQQDTSLDPVIDSSHLPRARQTAEIVARTLAQEWGQRTEVRQYEALAERSVGAFANLSVSKIEQILVEEMGLPSPPPGWKRDPNYRLPVVGAESLLESGKRILDHVAERLSPDRSAKLFVGHGGAFRLAAALGAALPMNEVNQLSMHYGGWVAFQASPANAGSLDLKKIGGAWKVRALSSHQPQMTTQGALD